MPESLLYIEVCYIEIDKEVVIIADWLIVLGKDSFGSY